MKRYLARITAAALALFIAAAPALSKDLALTGGAFRFNATDYYYPNFYDEAGFRGEINYEPWAKSSFRLQFYGYPGDDNIFETIAEYGYAFGIKPAGWELSAMPVAGAAIAKFQYPAPYYPVVTHQYLPWIRGGADVSIGHNVVGPVSLRGCYRFRALYYPGSSYAAFLPENGGTRTKLLHAPFGEVTVKVNDRWRLIGRGGCEWGGYYDDVFLPKEKKARPYGEVGFGLTL